MVSKIIIAALVAENLNPFSFAHFCRTFMQFLRFFFRYFACLGLYRILVNRQ